MIANSVVERGVVIHSRGNVSYEFQEMRQVVRRLPAGLVERLRLLWCDSKACATLQRRGQRHLACNARQTHKQRLEGGNRSIVRRLGKAFGRCVGLM